MSANAKTIRRARVPGTLEGILPGESLDDFEKRVGDDIPEWTEEHLARARPLSDFPELAAALASARTALRGQRGPQKAPTKHHVSIRLDPSVLAHFRAAGPGWQSRINEVLAEYVKRNSR
jgi:uncharacterized protein (DUF4415 family)